jgi:hypothetical protein
MRGAPPVLGLLLIALPLGAHSARAQRRPKTLTSEETQAFRFVDLLAAHAERQLGALARVSAMAGAPPAEPGVYVTLTKRQILVWDEPLIGLGKDGRIGRGDLASCPPLCVPKLREAIARALIDEAGRRQRADNPGPPHVLLLADRDVPLSTFLAAAYSAAAATADAPPPLRLAVRTAGAPMGEVPILLAPTHPIRLAENADPMLLAVTLDGGRYRVRARKDWLPLEEIGTSVGAVVRLAGELKARDPNKTVVFVGAEGDPPLGKLLDLIGPLRILYPDVVLGGLPKIVGIAD